MSRVGLILLFLILSSLLFLTWRVPSSEILVSFRFPELLSALSFGSTLAVSGAVFQNTLRNPLAEPYTLGVASASALGAVLSLLINLRPELGAVLFSSLSVLIIWFAGKLFKNTFSILLFGVGINALFSALILFSYALIPSYTLTDAIYVTLGFITPPSLKVSLLLVLLSLLTLVLGLYFKREVELLPLGSEIAYFSGVDSEGALLKLLVLFSLPVAVFISLFGIVGFVGIVVPHLVRLLGFRVGKAFILLNYLLGGALLIFSQFLSREVLYPTLLPVGVVTALFGAPAFIYLLWRYSGARG
ncbi:iron complex transport system permease protein [Thermovibrio guaymasensis]|uniref:Iron complex transport system permease protein n=1 Tax=Thermovibrio guaymasensis TaxID=240167 RepID=A0A420W6Z0_9BACT|nr:iron ABC transporter permease [Thermovibrio guaymasensis]RKQ61849.1 iron complex transport system permease protein [Thermovibrio guaymasensis]